MRCPNCGTNNRNPKKFCHTCGVLLFNGTPGSILSTSGAPPTPGGRSGWQLNTLPGQATNLSGVQNMPFPVRGGHGPSGLANSAPPNFEGIVFALEKRAEQEFIGEMQGQSQRSLFIWTFRVTRFDHNGNEIPPPIPVEMHGYYFHGSLRDGDRVRIPRSWQAGQTVYTTKVDNLTTFSSVRASGYGGCGARIVGFMGGIFFSIVAYFMLQFGNAMQHSPIPTQAARIASSFFAVWHIVCIGFIVIGIILALSSLFGFNSKRRR